MARRVENQFLLHQSKRTCITGTYIPDISKKKNARETKIKENPSPPPPPPLLLKKNKQTNRKSKKKAKEILGLDF